MEIEGFKSAWQKHFLEGQPSSTAAGLSPSLRFLRTSAIRDVQRSDELSRLIFCFLFALVTAGASMLLMAPGVSRVAAWLLALALVVEALTGVALLTRRFRAPATATVLDFIRREHSQVETRLRLELYSQRLLWVLAAAAVLLLILNPAPPNLRENIFDPFGRMAVVTGFLALAWRRAKSRSGEVRRELERYLKDLD